MSPSDSYASSAPSTPWLSLLAAAAVGAGIATVTSYVLVSRLSAHPRSKRDRHAHGFQEETPIQVCILLNPGLKCKMWNFGYFVSCAFLLSPCLTAFSSATATATGQEGNTAICVGHFCASPSSSPLKHQLSRFLSLWRSS